MQCLNITNRKEESFPLLLLPEKKYIFKGYYLRENYTFLYFVPHVKDVQGAEFL